MNIGTVDFILLLACQDEIVDGVLDTAKVKVPAGQMVEVYAATLHYAPCHVNERSGLRVAVVLPQGANTGALERGGQVAHRPEEGWLLAHPETAQGAHVGLRGVNIDIAGEI